MAVPDHVDVCDWRFERHVAQVCELGPRAVCELLRELGAHSLRMTEIEATAARYAAMDPDSLYAVGADVFPPRPSLRVVGGHRHG